MALSSPGYNQNGQLINEGTSGRQFTYDLNDRLTQVVDGATTAALAYDPAGRLQQDADSGGSSVTTQFLYDGNRLSAEYDGSGNLLRRYVHGAGGDEPLVWYEYTSGQQVRNYLHTDERGSVIAASNDNGAVTTYAYGPYGEPQSWSGSRFGYTGQIMLTEVQLYHYKGRAYDPTSGRFLQTDPVGYDGGENLYRYASDDPLDLADPAGHGSTLVNDVPDVDLTDTDSGTDDTAVALAQAVCDSCANLILASNSNTSVVYIGYQTTVSMDGVTAYHTFIVLQDPGSNQSFFFRGGPQPGYGGPSGGNGVQMANALADYDSAGGGNFGYCAELTCGYGDLTVSTGTSAQNTEYQKGPPAFYSGPYTANMSFAQAEATLLDTASSINSADIGYGPMTSNSNMVTDVGLAAIKAGHPFLHVWAPGY